MLSSTVIILHRFTTNGETFRELNIFCMLLGLINNSASMDCTWIYYKLIFLKPANIHLTGSFKYS